MSDEVLNLVEGHVAVNRHSKEDRFRDAQNAFTDLKKVCLFKVGVGLVEDEGNWSRKRVFKVLAYFLIGAFGHLGNVFQDLDVADIIVDIEMVGLVMIPIEFFVDDFIFTIVGVVDNLAEYKRSAENIERGKKERSYALSHDCSPFNAR